jgi:CBS domain-containing protein
MTYESAPMLFSISELIDEHEELLCVQKETKIHDALTLMVENDFSQLPIIDENNHLTGVITEQSILHTYLSVGNSVSLFDLDVTNCQTDPITIHHEASIFEALELLEKTYAVIVIEHKEPVGIITDYDTTTFFRNYSEGLITIQGIELTLRKYIESILSNDKLMQAALTKAFGMDRIDHTKTAKEYDELSFGDHIQLIISEDNWGRFEEFFAPKKMFSSFMGEVRDIRNKIAHFRGQLEAIETTKLNQAKNWLYSRPKINIDNDVPSFAFASLPPIENRDESEIRHGKYFPIQEMLSENRGEIKLVNISFDSLENLLGQPLPESARKHRAWWGNHFGNSQAKSWLKAGWLVDDVDLNDGYVMFRQSRSAYYPAFFESLLKSFKDKRPGVTRAGKVSLNNWFSFPSGISGFSYGWALPRSPDLRVEIYIDHGNERRNKEIFDELIKQRNEIEEIIGASLHWDRLDTKRACRISISKPFDVENPDDDRKSVKNWGVDMMLKFMDVFQPRIRNFK